MADVGADAQYGWPALAPASSSEIATATHETRRTYEQGASRYADATRGYAAFPGIREEVISFAAAAGAGAPVLDLGAGAGRDSALLSAIGKRVVAADICVPFLKDLHKSVSSPVCSPIGRICLDICDLPFRDAVFGGVWASGSLLHLPSARLSQGLSQVLRVLRSDGIAAISMRAGSGEGWREDGLLQGRRWFTLVEPDSFVSLMSEIGFCDLRYRYVGRSGWFLVSGHRL